MMLSRDGRRIFSFENLTLLAALVTLAEARRAVVTELYHK